jgi:hypothetical protein
MRLRNLMVAAMLVLGSATTAAAQAPEPVRVQERTPLLPAVNSQPAKPDPVPASEDAGDGMCSAPPSPSSTAQSLSMKPTPLARLTRPAR